MPGFNLLAFASGCGALRCLPILLRHDVGRIARQTSLEHWDEIFAWPQLQPAVRDMLEEFIVDRLCWCIPRVEPMDEVAHWITCARHLFINASTARGIARPMRLAVEHKRYDLATLLLGHASRAQLDALKKEANASDWRSVFPGIDERMLAVLKAADEQADVNERAAPAHSSAAASSRAPQSLQ